MEENSTRATLRLVLEAAIFADLIQQKKKKEEQRVTYC